MESLETSFVRHGQEVLLTHNKEGIKTSTFADYVEGSQTIETNEQFIHPGIIITQEHQIISGRRSDRTIVFTYRSVQKLNGFIIDGHRLFGLDKHNHIHMHSSARDSPEIFDLTRRPVGWCVVLKTKTIVYWTPISMHVYSAEKDRTINLRAHRAKITTVATSTATVVSGDLDGHICIWYVSSWECHHNILTGFEPCKSICISPETQVCVLTPSKFKGYDIVTGISTFSVDINAQQLSPMSNGILVSDEQRIAFFKDGICHCCFKNGHQEIIPSVGNRFYTIGNKKLVELELKSIHWPRECLKWIRNPVLPFSKEWTTRRYMDVLALTADIWIPRVEVWEPPKQWFRHEKLRDAIWDTVIANDMDVSYSWMFLTPHVMKKWYQKNIDCILTIIENDDGFDMRAVRLLKRIYKHVCIENKVIQRWCWQHHGRMAMKTILIHVLAHDESFFPIIMGFEISPDAIRCMSPAVVKLGLSEGHVAFFIRCLQAFHHQYVTPPNCHMYKIFKLIIRHVYLHLDVKTMDIPLPESGRWTKLTRPVPLNIGAFIKSGRTTGILTNIQFQPEVVLHWKPLNHTLDTILTSSEPIDIWKYKYESGPCTMLECALALMSEESWSSSDRIQPWKWFTTEMGAFEAETISIRVFDNPMRIMKADAEPPSILTSTHLRIEKSEQVVIQSVTPLWSYHKEHLYRVIPLRLKICHLAMQSTRSAPLSIVYAQELLQSIRFKTICTEHKWRTHQRVSVMASDMGMFFIGFDSGDISEYHSTADTTPIRHYIKHTNIILSLLIFESRMMSLCEDEMNIWCLDTGTNIFTTTSQMQFNSAISAAIFSAWVIETDEEQTIVSMWDVIDELVIKRIPITTDGPIITTNTPAIITNRRVITLDSDAKEYTLHKMRGDITCATSTISGICGGTSEGIVFIVDHKNEDIHEWSSTNSHTVTAITAMGDQPYVITGSGMGDITIWDIQKMSVVGIIHLSNATISHIHFENMFAVVTQHTTVNLLSVVHDRCVLATNTMQKIASWSPLWKSRLLKKTTDLIQPAIVCCILNNVGVEDAIALVEECTTEYDDRLTWCKSEFVEVLLEAPNSLSKEILRRLASFRGPKLECVICHGDDSEDTVCFIKTCQHRFHTGCIAELVRKTPEYHQEMQYEYALEVSLKCPSCRTSFVSEDVEEDVFLSRICAKIR